MFRSYPRTSCRTYPLVDGDTLTGIVFEREPGEANGEYDIIPKQSSGAKSNSNPNPNYDITFVKGTLTISHQTVKIPDPDPRQFFFTGFEQEYHIPESEFYEVRYNKQIFVGTYRVVVYLEEGYIWEDGTTGPKYYTFVINPRFISIPPKEEEEIVLPDPPIDDVLDTEEHTAFINGYPDGTVRPNGNITRAEVAMIFYRLLIDKTVGDDVSFSDVEDGQWYAVAVKILASRGIITGYSDGTFKPNKYITRAEFTAIATRFVDVFGGEAAFSDVSGEHWAAKNIATAAYYGWVKGYTDGTFKPDNMITRAEVATSVNRMLDRHADTAFIDEHLEELKHFTDLEDTTMWYFYEMAEAVNSHEHYFDESDSEVWDSVAGAIAD